VKKRRQQVIFEFFLFFFSITLVDLSTLPLIFADREEHRIGFCNAASMCTLVFNVVVVDKMEPQIDYFVESWLERFFLPPRISKTNKKNK
jgi:hypothetical protein